MDTARAVKDFLFIIKQPVLECHFTAGSIREGVSILEEDESAVASFFTTCKRLAASAEIGQETSTQTVTEAVPGDATATATATKRKRRTNAEIAADAAKAAAVTAPEPMPVPVAAVAPPPPPPLAAAPPVVPAVPAPPPPPTPGLEIPAFLDRRPAPPPPPVLNSPADIGRGAQEIIANLKARCVGAPDGGQAVADWVTAHKAADGTNLIMSAGAKIDEVYSVLPFTKNANLAVVAAGLGVVVPA